MVTEVEKEIWARRKPPIIEQTSAWRYQAKEKLPGKVFSGRPVEDDKWRDNLASAKTFIDTKERMPNQRSGDAEERRLGKWIANNKIRKEEPTANMKS